MLGQRLLAVLLALAMMFVFSAMLWVFAPRKRNSTAGNVARRPRIPVRGRGRARSYRSDTLVCRGPRRQRTH